jgi:hypothetical protein
MRVATRCAVLMLAVSAESAADPVERRLAFLEPSEVLVRDASELRPSTLFRAGRERHYLGHDADLELDHGAGAGLELGLLWSFSSQNADVLVDETTEEIGRVSDSELAHFGVRLRQQLTDAEADALGSALELGAALGARRGELLLRVVADRRLPRWWFGGNVTATYELEFLRDGEASRVGRRLSLEPALGASYLLGSGLSLGAEVRLPVAMHAPERYSALFGGPALAWSAERAWLVLGVQPQFAALSGKSAERALHLGTREKLELRVRAGFEL